MPIIQRPDLVQKVRKTYEILGPDAIATISPELVPVVLVDDISSAEGTVADKAFGGEALTSAAGEYPHVSLYLPTGNDDTILHITKVIIAYSSTNYQIRDASSLGAGGNYSLRDKRLLPRTSPKGRVDSASEAVLSGTDLSGVQKIHNTVVTLEFNPDWWLTSGYGFSVAGAAVASYLGVMFWWEEIPV